MIRQSTQLKQYTCSSEVINWFTQLEDKQRLRFIIFDIESFYPSITPTLLDNALDWARNYVDVTPQQRVIIHQDLYNEGEPWVKKGGINFDIGMGAFHGAQACEIVGLYLLNLLQTLPDFQAIL